MSKLFKNRLTPEEYQATRKRAEAQRLKECLEHEPPPPDFPHGFKCRGKQSTDHKELCNPHMEP